ncbi:MAG: HAMP domain-containing protein [Acidobacteria bacterium]|nr:HAMP domain-containing protein [Acidobacteriota bacterium]
MTILTSVVSLCVASAILIGYHYRSSTSNLRGAAVTLADVVGFNSGAALGFGDRREAAVLLQALDAEDDVAAGAIFDSSGKLFAAYTRHEGRVALNLPTAQQRDADGLLVASRPIVLDGEPLGTIVIWASLDQVHAELRQYVAIVAGVLVLAAVAAFLVSLRLQARISGPILALARHAEHVSTAKDYTTRVVAPTSDEIGTLYTQFNEMLRQIDERDAALRLATVQLEHRVRERTAELTREIDDHRQTGEALRMARDGAEAANQAKSAFLANMSHELRTPLNAIIGFSELIAEELQRNPAVDIRPDLSRIRSAGKHLLELVSDVLDISKIEAGKMAIAVKPFDVEGLLEDVVSMSRPLAEKNRNAFHAGPFAGLGTMEGDVVRVRQVLFNLVSNAAKFTRDGSVTLSAVRQSGNGGDFLRVDVADTGIGIAPQHMAHLFKHFSQADESTTKRFGGTGLGLAISQHLCRAMGGEITVISTPGKGSTFTVVLPARVTAGPVVEPEAAPARPLRSSAPVLRLSPAAKFGRRTG